MNGSPAVGLHLFLLLFGFFLGNLSPQGDFISTIFRVHQIPFNEHTLEYPQIEKVRAERGSSDEAQNEKGVNLGSPRAVVQSSDNLVLPISSNNSGCNRPEVEMARAPLGHSGEAQILPFLSRFFSWTREVCAKSFFPYSLSEESARKMALHAEPEVSSLDDQFKRSLNVWTKPSQMVQAPLGHLHEAPIWSNPELFFAYSERSSKHALGFFKIIWPGPVPTLILVSECINLFSASCRWKTSTIQTRDYWSELRSSVTRAKLGYSGKARTTIKQSSEYAKKDWFVLRVLNKVQNTRRSTANSQKTEFVRRANSIKIGFLLGIFVDAFKVGS